MRGMGSHYEAVLPDILHQVNEDQRHTCPICVRPCSPQQHTDLKANIERLIDQIKSMRFEADVSLGDFNNLILWLV